MPESAIQHLCPYLRQRQSYDPIPAPDPENRCALVSTLHLPPDYQAEYCLVGRYEACPRYQRQQGRPIPRYVRGARPVNVRPATPTVPMHALPWRRPRVRSALKWAVMALLLVLFVQLWRMRMAQVPALRVERVTPPAQTYEATPTPPTWYLPPTVGPEPW